MFIDAAHVQADVGDALAARRAVEQRLQVLLGRLERSARPASRTFSLRARSAASTPERLPKITVSSSELAPRRLAPWTLTQAVSPAA